MMGLARVALAVLVIGAALLPARVHGQSAATAADSAAIRRTALDYIRGWYEGDAERMRGALHPELAKRIVERGDGGGTRLGKITAEQLVQAAARNGGGGEAGGQRRADIRILDVFGAAATVRLDAEDWVDYLHLGRTDRGWVIINVLWELRQPAR